MIQVTWRLVAVLALAGCVSAERPTPDQTALAPAATAPAPVLRLGHNLRDTGFGTRVRRAILTSPVARANAAMVAASVDQLGAEKSAYYPQVDLRSTLDDRGEVTPELTLSQLVYDAGATRQRIRAARMAAERDREDQVSALASETLAAVEVTLAVNRTRALLEVARTNEAALARLQEMIRDRTEAGAGSVADLTTAESRLTTARSEVLEATAALASAEASYRDVFGAAPPAALEPVPDAPALGLNDPAQIIAGAPGMISLQLLQQQTRHEIAALEAGAFPRFAVQVSSGLGLRPGDIDDVQAGLVASVPLSTGGQRRSRIASAKQALASYEAEAEDLRRDLTRALDQARSEIASRPARLANARQASATAARALEDTRSQYSINRSTVTALLDAQRDLALTERRLIEIEAATKLDAWALLGLTADILEAVGLPNPRDSVILSAGSADPA